MASTRASNYLQVIRTYRKEIDDLGSIPSKSNSTNYQEWLRKYFNVLNEIAKLDLQGLIPLEIAEYFRLDFQNGKELLHEFGSAQQLMSFNEWCTKRMKDS